MLAILPHQSLIHLENLMINIKRSFAPRSTLLPQYITGDITLLHVPACGVASAQTAKRLAFAAGDYVAKPDTAPTVTYKKSRAASVDWMELIEDKLWYEWAELSKPAIDGMEVTFLPSDRIVDFTK